MKKARLIYNPVSGKKMFATKLDTIVDLFQSNGWQIIPYRTTGKENGETYAKVLQEDTYDAVIVAGGDGTVHHVANGLLSSELSLPMGIIPVGTANDFAAHLNLPQDTEECCRAIINGEMSKVDVGWANGKYFLNIASAGLLSEVPHKTDVAMKNVLGKLAYYLKGIETIPNFRAIPVEIVGTDFVFKEEALLFLILNGRTAGGFSRIAPRASIVDGLFDVMIFKPVNLGQFFYLFLKVIKGEHVNDPRVVYFQTNQLVINCSSQIDTDLDGEAGPGFPLEIRVLPEKLHVYAPKASKLKNINALESNIKSEEEVAKLEQSYLSKLNQGLRGRKSSS